MITPHKEQKEKVLTKEFFISHLNSTLNSGLGSLRQEFEYKFDILTEMVAKNTVDITEMKENIGCLKSDVRDIKYDVSEIRSTLGRHDRRITFLEKVVA